MLLINANTIIKGINENVSFESRLNLKDISEWVRYRKKNFKRKFNLKKAEMFGNVTIKVLKESSKDCNKLLRFIWNFEKLEKQNFPQTWKLTDRSPVYKEKDPTLLENYWPVFVLRTVSNVFERIVQMQFSSFIEDFLSPHLCG